MGFMFGFCLEFIGIKRKKEKKITNAIGSKNGGWGGDLMHATMLMLLEQGLNSTWNCMGSVKHMCSIEN
jgi:hypothetical protein